MTLIKTSDFFDDGYKKDLKEIAEQWRKLGEDVRAVAKLLQAAGKGVRKSLEETSTSTSGGQDQIKKMSKEIQQLQRVISRFEMATSEAGKAQAFWNEQTRKANYKNKIAAQEVMAKAGSYKQLSAQLKIAVDELQSMEIVESKTSQRGKELRKEVDRLNKSITDFDKEMGNYRRNVGNYSSALKGAKLQTDNYGKTVKNVTGLVKRFVAVYLGFEAFRSAVRITRDLTVQTDSLRLAYSKIIPDSGKLAKTNAFLSKTAENYGIDINSLRKNYLRFTAASRSTNLSMEETQAIFNSVAKAGSVMGLEAIRMDRAFNALEQMLSKGKVSSEELRQQLGDSLPGSMEIMADALDVTTLELSKMLEEGKILSEDALPKFAKQLEITYGIQNLTRVENLAASQGRLKTAIIELVDAMETTGTFRDFYTAMADGVKFIARNVDAIKNLIKSITALGIAYAGLNFGAFISSIRLTRIGMLRLIVTIKQAVVATKAWNLALRSNPLGIMITGLSTVAGLLFAFRNELAPTNTELERTNRIYSDLNEQLRENIRLNEEKKPEDKESIADLTKRTTEEWKQAKIQEIRLKMREKEAQIERLSGVMQSPGIARALAMARSELSGLSKELKEVALVDPLGEMGRSTLFSQGQSNKKTKDDDTTPPADDEKAAAFKKERAIIDTMEDGFEKRKRLLKLNRDEEAWEWRGHKDLLILIEKKYQRELAELEEGEKSGVIKRNIAERLAEIELQRIYVQSAEESFKKIEALRRLDLEKAELIRDRDILNAKEGSSDKFDAEQEYLKQKLEINIKALKDINDLQDKYDKEGEKRDKEELRLKKEQLSIELEIENNKVKAQNLDKLQEELELLGNKIRYLRELKDLAKTDDEQRLIQSQIDAAESKFIAKSTQGVDAVGKTKDAKIFGFSLRKGIKKLLPEEVAGDEKKVDRAFEAVVSGFALAKDAMTDYYRTAIQLSNELVQQRNQEVASAERALDREIASRNAGYANFVDDAQKRLDQAKKNQEEALRQRQAFQRQQLIADSISQASGLTSAAVNIFKQFPFPLGLAFVAPMFGAFVAAKAKAFELTRQNFAEGDLSIIGGGRHGSGNDTLVGFSGGRAQFAEQGEARMILSRRVTAKYKDVLPDLFESLNRGTFDIDALKGTNSPIPSLVVNARTDTSRMEKELVAIRRQGETQTIYDNGKKVVIKGNRIKRYV